MAETTQVADGGDATALRERLVMALVEIAKRRLPMVEVPPVSRRKVAMEDLYGNKDVLRALVKVIPDMVPSRTVLAEAFEETVEAVGAGPLKHGVAEGWGYFGMKMIAYLRPGVCNISSQCHPRPVPQAPRDQLPTFL